MSLHAAPDYVPEDDTRRGIGPVAAVLVAAITAVTTIALALVLTGHPEQAANIATVALLAGVGMAIGFRKQWTR